MGKTDAVEVGCKILGVYLLILGLASFSGNIVPLSSGILRGERDTVLFFTGFLLADLVTLAGSICLIRGAGLIADRLAGEDRRVEEAKEGWDKTTLEEVAFAAIGLFLIVGALPGLPWSLIQLVTTNRYTGQSFTADRIADVFAILIKSGLGLYLILRARGLVTLIHRLRTA